MPGKQAITTLQIPTDNVVERGGLSCVEYHIAEETQTQIRNTVWIPDPHGDPVGLENSFRLAELVTPEGQPTDFLHDDKTRITILGDVFGRGTGVLAVLQRIKEVRARLIAGNHEIIMMQALLAAPGDSFQSTWLQSEKMGARLKRELETIKGSTVKPIRELQRLFFEDADAYAPLLAPGTLKAAHREDDTLGIHAGLEKEWMHAYDNDGVAGMNKQFAALSKRSEIKHLLSKGSHNALFWKHRENDPEDIVSSKIADRLVDDGVRWVARGHDGVTRPIIDTYPNGLRVVTLDTRISNFANRNLTEISSGGAVMIANETGKTIRFIPRVPDTLDIDAEALRSER